MAHSTCNPLSVARFESSEEFLIACRAWLLEKEELYHGLLSTAELIGKQSSIFSPPFGLFSLTRNKSIEGCAIHALPDGLMLSEIPRDGGKLLAKAICDAVEVPHRIIGNPESAKLTALEICRYKQRRSIHEATWTVFLLHTVSANSNELTGGLRLGRHTDWTTIRDWAAMYERENPAPISIEEYFSFKLSQGNLYVWEDTSTLKAVATTAAQTKNAIKISAVYTPPQLRKQGYASAAVHSLCKELLQKGRKFITLAALEGDRSASIYKRIGFKEIGRRESHLIIE